jgi:Ca2+-transporting ATPase
MSTLPEIDLATWGVGVDEVLQKLVVDSQVGLDEEEVLRRRLIYGRNQLQVVNQRHIVSILVDQFKSIVIALLVVAGILAALFSDIAEAVAIFAVIVLNALIGFTTEWRAVRSMEALRRLADIDCVGLRASTVIRLSADELVPGDIVILDAGDLVPADLRLIRASKLNADESTLTGESLPVHKHTEPLAKDTMMLDRHNMAFKGTSITRGAGRGVVVATGTGTEFGKIFEQVSSATAQRTPLEKRLNSLGNRLAWVVIAIGVLVAVGGILTGRDTFLAIEVAIALSVAAIPEGLPIVATIALARGMWRMAKRNALITKLSAVETLGTTSVILTDKTGTLTENRMSATTVLLADVDIEFGEELDVPSSAVLDELLVAAALCNNASLQQTVEADTSGVGDPTEVALLVAAANRGIWREALLKKAPEIHEDPFDPVSKRMATVHDDGEKYTVAVKGSPEIILSICRSVQTCDGVVPLKDNDIENWLTRVEQLCGRGLRTIAIARKSVDALDMDPYDDLILLGVIGLEDPVRDGVRDAIGRCHSAGVSIVMVTGDHAKTARNIATKIGVIDESSDAHQSVGGEDVDRLFAEGRTEELLAVRVFSRVTPEQKLQLINLYQQQEHVVAMTGDGVNDAPALKKADIGIAMGVRGTAVAKEASDMVLQDDEFSSIVAAVGHGRVIVQNIRKFVVYLLSCNSSEVLIVSLATITGAPLPLLPLQILFLNLVTDVFPALALSVGPEQPSLMKMAPRPAGEGLLTRRHWLEIALYGVVMAIVVLAAMTIAFLCFEFGREKAVTVAFCTLALAQIWHVFNMRASRGRLFDNEIVRNVWIWLALGLCLLLTFAAVYLPPLSNILRLTDPGRSGWLLILVLSLVPLFIAPAVRYVARPK